jgi:putative endonuclease
MNLVRFGIIRASRDTISLQDIQDFGMENPSMNPVAGSFLRRRSRGLWEWLEGGWFRFRLSRPYPRRQTDEPLGAYGERLAAVFLQRQGYLILERSYRIKSGEIDLIAVWKRKVVVFVEVKTWASSWENAGGPSDAVDEKKQEKITRVALAYMKRHHLLESSGRADVIAVFASVQPGMQPEFRHFVSAFEAIGQFQMFS